MTEQKLKQLQLSGKLMIGWGVLNFVLLLLLVPTLAEINQKMAAGIQQAAQQGEPEQVSTQFRSIIQGAFNFLQILAGGYPVVCVVTGFWILRQKHLGWCVVGSALVCLGVPLGTLLGIWTLILLRNAELRSRFQQQESGLNSGAA